MERTCSTCRWWAPNVNGKPRVGTVFACTNPKLNQPSFEIAEVTDCAGADEGGHFLTGKDFGCVHYEVSPLPPAQLPSPISPPTS